MNPEFRSLHRKNHLASATLTTIQGNPVSRLGLATSYLKESGCWSLAVDSGINYLFFYALPKVELVQELKDTLAAQRESVFVATGSESRQPEHLREYFDPLRRSLGTNIIDAFFLEYVTPSEDPDLLQAALIELRSWQSQGQLRYVGASSHNRSTALRLIEDKSLDVLMLRYNMAHRKIEADVLPAALEANLPIVAFTCTRWGSLLNGHPDWTGEIPTAADCYRYVLHHPAVQIALTGSATRQQLTENLSVLKSLPLTPAELKEWQAYGDLVYGTGQDAFDTQWV
ncbi:aldo/keto reductase [Leptolyngbya ohadii]|uniref:aldo/keto reductase n=1 Tax=Leptolyngbya ohadii TaxID=1962290 RepID=UPI000B5A01B6|nr:aldo/keto reductase [Leptolyngbya ohadii]